jgi:hypothetical protein
VRGRGVFRAAARSDRSRRPMMVRSRYRCACPRAECRGRSWRKPRSGCPAGPTGDPIGSSRQTAGCGRLLPPTRSHCAAEETLSWNSPRSSTEDSQEVRRHRVHRVHADPILGVGGRPETRSAAEPRRTARRTIRGDPPPRGPHDEPFLFQPTVGTAGSPVALIVSTPDRLDPACQFTQFIEKRTTRRPRTLRSPRLRFRSAQAKSPIVGNGVENATSIDQVRQ